MTRFGIFCPPTIGHLNPMCILALELQRRGHTVILFGVADALEIIDKLNIATALIGAADYPEGSTDLAYRTLAKLTGRQGLEFSIDYAKREAKMLFREAPKAICDATIDLLIIDQISSSMATVADYLDLPFVTVCNAMLINAEPKVPPYSTPWAYSTTPWALLRNRLGNALVDYLIRDFWHVIVKQRQDWNLPPYKRRDDAFSPLAQVCQLPQAFDFPRERLPAHFHYIGRLEDPSGREPIAFDHVEFPFGRLNGKPLIYASLGTLQNQRPEIFECIATACSQLDVQLVISLGNPQAQSIDLPGHPIVVPFAPHQKLIELSTLVVTHAGMNTVLTALGCGIPLVAIPITNEQPGIAARLERSGAGKMLPLNKLDVPTLRDMISETIADPSYLDNAQRLKTLIQASGGVDYAVDIIEKAAHSRQPVV
jgi:zeaxanthin glucosyltransferase